MGLEFVSCVVINIKVVDNYENTTRWGMYLPKHSLLSGPASPRLTCETDEIMPLSL